MSTMTLEQVRDELRTYTPSVEEMERYADAIDAYLTSREAVGEWPIRGKIWQRGDEWVLDLEGVYDDQAFYCRHTEPLTTARADVAGLPSLYAEKPEQAVGDGVVQRVIDAALALISDAEEVETADGLMNVAQLHLWHALEDAIEKVGSTEIANFTPRPAVATAGDDEVMHLARQVVSFRDVAGYDSAKLPEGMGAAIEALHASLGNRGYNRPIATAGDGVDEYTGAFNRWWDEHRATHSVNVHIKGVAIAAWIAGRNAALASRPVEDSPRLREVTETVRKEREEMIAVGRMQLAILRITARHHPEILPYVGLSARVFGE